MNRKQSIIMGMTRGFDFHESAHAAKQHMWPDLRQLMIDFFVELARHITDYEKEILELLRLPSIDRVRRGGNMDEPYTPPENVTKQLIKIFAEWRGKLIGDGPDKVYNKHMQKAFDIGDRRFRENMGEGKQGEFDSEQLRRIVQAGAVRIAAELGDDKARDVIGVILEMAAEGKNPMEIGRWLHKEIGEGHSWWWNRLARSESALAADGAFDADMEKYKIPYEQWICEANACVICQQFCDGVWRRGDGPHVVSDTHPHCLCVRIPRLIYDEQPRAPWIRPTPYEQPYTQAELEALS